jgi:hypothetical protein
VKLISGLMKLASIGTECRCCRTAAWLSSRAGRLAQGGLAKSRADAFPARTTSSSGFKITMSLLLDDQIASR